MKRFPVSSAAVLAFLILVLGAVVCLRVSPGRETGVPMEAVAARPQPAPVESYGLVERPAEPPAAPVSRPECAPAPKAGPSRQESPLWKSRDAGDAEIVKKEQEIRTAEPTIVRSRLVTVMTPALQVGEPVSMEFFDGTELHVAFESRSPGQTGSEVWTGKIVGQPLSEVLLSVRDGVVVGDFRTDQGVYEIRPLGNGLHAVRELDFTQQGPCGTLPPSEEHGRSETGPNLAGDTGGTSTGSGSTMAGDGGPIIDVMVVYTPAVRTALGSATAVNNLIDTAVAGANTAYSNSQVTQRIRLVHTAEIAYTESGSAPTDLNRLESATDGIMDAVHGLRNTYGADVVTLLLQTSDYAGYADMMGTPSVNFAPRAFCVVKQSAISNHTYAHEVGHVMGCDHDQFNSAGGGSYSYSNGWRFTAGGISYRTVMAYPPGTRIRYFSNPSVLYSGVATGTANANNALSLNNTAPTVAQFRMSAIPMLMSITVSPSTASVTTGASQQFTAQGYDQFGNPFPATFTWTATGGAVNAAGLYTAGSTAGTYSVTASSSGVSGSATVTVTRPPPVFTSIAVSPGFVPLVPGGTRSFTASGRDQYGGIIAIPGPVTWSATVGTITSSGFYTSVTTPGLYNSAVRANYGSVQGTASVRVANPANVIRGDANADGVINSGDITFLSTHVFQSGPPPAYEKQGNANAIGAIDSADVIYLVNYVFKSGPPPPP